EANVKLNDNSDGHGYRLLSFLVIAVGLLLFSCQPASAKGVGNGKLNGNPSPVAFGNTMVGSYQTSAVVLTNSGGSDLTINNATMSGAGFAVGNISLPLV